MNHQMTCNECKHCNHSAFISNDCDKKFEAGCMKTTLPIQETDVACENFEISKKHLMEVAFRNIIKVKIMCKERQPIENIEKRMDYIIGKYGKYFEKVTYELE